ncbi:MAG: hypothetical protein MK212_17675 [Saprospiraceae bacterium]|nr:hypothetical protein [Saprospiraceae bacterium]
MNRNQIKINLEVIIKYCKREHSMQAKVYPKQIAKQQMSQYEANQNHLLITEYKELAELLQLKGIRWHEFKKMINDLPAKRVVEQKNLF